VGRTNGHEALQAPPAHDELVGDVVRSLGYLQHTRQVAERAGAGDLVVAELADLEARLAALHLVALVLGDWCAHCGAELTDPARSPSGARHCRTCRVGWTLTAEGGQLRAIGRPWPAPAGAAATASRSDGRHGEPAPGAGGPGRPRGTSRP